MKKILILFGVLISLVAVRSVLAQTAEGTISYDVKINLHRRLPPDRQEMKASIPEFRTTKEQLIFNGNESLYKPIIEDEEEESFGGGGVQMRFRQPNTERYLDQATGKVISKQELMGKDYLIADSVKLAPWKLGSETKTIQGYECKQAYYTDESNPNAKQEITVWYTDKIRPFLGPDRFNTLPGAVLAVDINNAERVIVASKIEMRPLKKNELKIPSKGIKTTPQEFRKLMDEQMRNSGGGIMIRN
ncbi:MAG TPA: GLPGLI family protein [Cyclobacteriaceae bacterium]